jgi:cytochrome c1
MPMPVQTFRPAIRAVLCLPLCLPLLLAACGDKQSPQAVAGGDVDTGRHLVTQYQCGACHKIPDVPGAGGTSGPSLEGFGKLSYIAGRIPNQPAKLDAWLLDPPALKPGTPMPAMGLTEQEARHIAAFLYSLR